VDTDRNDDPYDYVGLTDAGWTWIENNLDRVPTTKPRNSVRRPSSDLLLSKRGDLDDEIPF